MNRRFIQYLLDMSIVSLSTVVLSLVAGAWNGYPRGNDVYNSLTRTKYILSYFPNILWNFQWDSGSFFVSHSPFSILPNAIVALIVKLTGGPIPLVLNSVATLSAIATGIGVYAIVLEITNDSYASVATSVMLSGVATEGRLWFVWLGVGEYEMFISSAMFVFSVFTLILFLKNNSVSRLVVAVVFLSLALQSHVWVAVVSALTALSIILASSGGLRNALRNFAVIFLPAALLSSYLYIPVIAARGTTPLTLEGIPSQFYDVLERNAISYSILPLTFVLLVLTRIYKIKIGTTLEAASVRSFMFVSMLLAVHALMYFFWRFIWGVEFWDSLHYLTVFLVIICGIAIARIRLRINLKTGPAVRLVSFGFPIGMILIIVLSAIPSGALALYSPPISPGGAYNTYDGQAISRLMQNVNDTFTYRIGIPDHSSPGAWFSYAYDNPETGHYLGGLSLHTEWDGWLLVSVWQTPNNYEETSYILKWFAVKWFIWPHPSIAYPSYVKFLDRPQSYELVSTSDDKKYFGFTFKDAVPIVSPVNSPAFLVIGDDVAYGNVFRSLAYSESAGIPPVVVRGGQFIDDHTVDELRRFQAIILYGYDYHNRDAAYALLGEYVKEGGNLVVDTGYSPDSASPLLPLPFPIAATQGTDFGKSWYLTETKHEVTNQIDFAKFSPAVYSESYPWGLSASTNESVRTGAQILAWDGGRPVLVASQLGPGRVIWSGINLPYHITVYKNSEESKFFCKVLQWAAQSSNNEEKQASAIVTRPNPDRLDLSVRSKANGILFKESYFEDWHAFMIADGQRTDLPIYRSGPDFMYVPLPSAASQPFNVTFEYTMSNIEWSGAVISIITLVVLAAYAAREGTRKKPVKP